MKPLMLLEYLRRVQKTHFDFVYSMSGEKRLTAKTLTTKIDMFSVPAKLTCNVPMGASALRDFERARHQRQAAVQLLHGSVVRVDVRRRAEHRGRDAERVQDPPRPRKSTVSMCKTLCKTLFDTT